MHLLISHLYIFKLRLIFDGNEILISSSSEKKYLGIILPFSTSILNYSFQPFRGQCFTKFSILQNRTMTFMKINLVTSKVIHTHTQIGTSNNFILIMLSCFCTYIVSCFCFYSAFLFTCLIVRLLKFQAEWNI